MSRNNIIFPYGIRLQEDGVINIFPAAEVNLSYKNGEKISLIFIIDSGATLSALPKTDAVGLGVIAKNGTALTIAGIGKEKLSGWKHEISVWIADIPIKLPVVFINNALAPRVLGRAGIFDQFTIIFEEEKQRTALFQNNSSRARAIQKIIDKLK